MKAYVGSGSVTPSSPFLGTIWKPVYCFTLRSLYPREIHHCAHGTGNLVFLKVNSLPCWDSKPKPSSLWPRHYPNCPITNVNDSLYHTVLLQNYEISIYLFQTRKAAQFDKRLTIFRKNMLSPFYKRNFGAGVSSETSLHMYSKTRHFLERHLQAQMHQNALTVKLASVCVRCLAKHVTIYDLTYIIYLLTYSMEQSPS